jgi:hypothetical protein
VEDELALSWAERSHISVITELTDSGEDVKGSLGDCGLTGVKVLLGMTGVKGVP